MRRDSLPSPGMLNMGIDLQGRMARAISAVEVNAGQSGGVSSMAKQLDNFLVASRTAIAGLIDAVAPTMLSRAIGLSNVNYVDGYTKNQIVRIRTSKMLDRSFLPTAAQFTLASPAKVIGKVDIDGPDILLYVTVPYTTADTTATVAYSTTAPAANQAKDLSGNILAAFAATAITAAPN